MGLNFVVHCQPEFRGGVDSQREAGLDVGLGLELGFDLGSGV